MINQHQTPHTPLDFDIESELRDTLSKDEKLLWAGRPETGLKLRPSDAVLIPFSLMWCGFAIFWESTVFFTDAPFFFKLWGIPFVLVGLYITVGRFIIDILQRKNTIYGITNDRVIIRSGIFSKQTKSLNIRTISDITFKEKSDGSGTISLGPTGLGQSMLFAGNNWSTWSRAKSTPSLEFIGQVRKVYNILIERQRAL